MSQRACVILCRHGATELNRSVAGTSAERVRGWLDVPLDAEGRKEAESLSERLEQFPLADIYCSTLQRAEDTALAIARPHKLVPKPERGLLPWNVGKMAGEPVAEMLPKMKLLTAYPDRSAPGGEPFASFGKRFLAELCSLLSKAKRDGACICVVTHTRNLQLAKAWLAAGSPADLSYDVGVMNDYSHEVGTGGVMVLEAT